MRKEAIPQQNLHQEGAWMAPLQALVCYRHQEGHAHRLFQSRLHSSPTPQSIWTPQILDAISNNFRRKTKCENSIKAPMFLLFDEPNYILFFF